MTEPTNKILIRVDGVEQARAFTVCAIEQIDQATGEPYGTPVGRVEPELHDNERLIEYLGGGMEIITINQPEHMFMARTRTVHGRPE